MSSQAKTNAMALHEILLSISDSLNEAQHQLRNMPPYDEYGRPNTIYHLPYLDFSLEVISEIAQDAYSQKMINSPAPPVYLASGFSGGLAFSPYTGRPQMLYTLVDPGKDIVSKSANKITSTLSGRFVAVLPNDGMPQLFISFMSKHFAKNKYHLTVKLIQATGEPVAGQKIEVNFDRMNSEALNEKSMTIPPAFLGPKEGYTNKNGEFETAVDLDVARPFKTFVFVANSGTIFTSIAIDKA